MFSGENDFLLIDEPTNHLDQIARETVKRYLSSKKGFILVSHDRDLLDTCTDHVLVLNRQTIEVQSGNFSSWWENKQRKDRFARSENVTPAHLYIWDEPLNYIDVFSKMQIEKLLLEYQPTILFVEHDVQFREMVATGMVGV